MTAHIPNLLTLLRIASTPFLIIVLDDGRYELALLIFAFAGVTDALDGYIAKRWGYESRLGGLLDPLADKVLIVSTCVMLTVNGDIPLWLLVTIGFRDIFIIGGFLILTMLHGQLQMRPSFVSKFNTVMQIVLVGLVLFDRAANLQMDNVIMLVIATVFVTTIVSLVHYVWFWGIHKPVDLVESRGADVERH